MFNHVRESKLLNVYLCYLQMSLRSRSSSNTLPLSCLPHPFYYIYCKGILVSFNNACIFQQSLYLSAMLLSFNNACIFQQSLYLSKMLYYVYIRTFLFNRQKVFCVFLFVFIPKAFRLPRFRQ